jgi:hypothetical protein
MQPLAARCSVSVSPGARLARPIAPPPWRSLWGAPHCSAAAQVRSQRLAATSCLSLWLSLSLSLSLCAASVYDRLVSTPATRELELLSPARDMPAWPRAPRGCTATWRVGCTRHAPRCPRDTHRVESMVCAGAGFGAPATGGFGAAAGGGFGATRAALMPHRPAACGGCMCTSCAAALAAPYHQ